MNRFEIASEKLSSARRHLITPRPEGDRASLLAALQDVESGLAALGETRLVSNAASSSVEMLKSLLPAARQSTDRFEWGTFAGAVDELASLLYWSESSAA